MHLPQKHITSLIVKNFNYFGIKTATHTTKTIKQTLKNNFKNTNLLSDVGVYNIRRLDCNKLYIGETNRNLNIRIYKHKTDFKTGNSINFLLSHNISNNLTFDFQNVDIFAFIPDWDKRRIIEASFISYFVTILQWHDFYQILRSLAKIMLKDFKILL